MAGAGAGAGAGAKIWGKRGAWAVFGYAALLLQP